MLLVFSLSITPKIFLHKLVASHKDRYPSTHSTQDQISKTGYRCDCESQVVEVPYLNYAYDIDLPYRRSFPVDRIIAERSFPSSPFLMFGLRGPPSLL